MNKYDPALWPQDDEELDEDMSEEEMDTFLFVDPEHTPKEYPMCPECGNKYVCTHDRCDMCLSCERKLRTNKN